MENQMKKYDVYSYGMISSSRLYVLKSGFPRPDQYAEIDRYYSTIGGEAANSAIVLSKLGLKVRIDGNWLSRDENGMQTKAILDDFKIDTSRLKFKKEGPCPHEVVFSDQMTRTIFGNYGKLLSKTRRWNVPVKSDIAQSKMICLDPFFYQGSSVVNRYAKQLNIPCVTVDCQHSDEILKDSAIAVISAEFRNRFYKESPEDVFKKYLRQSKGLVVFTSGNGKIIFGRRESRMKSYSPHKIKAIDTAGAGDSFRAGMIYGALRKWPDEQMIAFSSALAAMVCCQFPGVLNSPTFKEVAAFLKKTR